MILTSLLLLPALLQNEVLNGDLELCGAGFCLFGQNNVQTSLNYQHLQAYGRGDATDWLQNFCSFQPQSPAGPSHIGISTEALGDAFSLELRRSLEFSATYRVTFWAHSRRGLGRIALGWAPDERGKSQGINWFVLTEPVDPVGWQMFTYDVVVDSEADFLHVRARRGQGPGTEATVWVDGFHVERIGPRVTYSAEGGIYTFQVWGAEPEAVLVMGWGRRLLPQRIPFGRRCGGVPYIIDPIAVWGVGLANPAGQATISLTLPPTVSTTIHVQALAIPECHFSQVVNVNP